MNESLILQSKIDKTRHFRRRIISFGIIIIVVGVLVLLGKFFVSQIGVFSEYGKISTDVHNRVSALSDLVGNSKDIMSQSSEDYKSHDKYKMLESNTDKSEQLIETSNTLFKKYSFGTVSANFELTSFLDKLETQSEKLNSSINLVNEDVLDSKFEETVAKFKGSISSAETTFDSSKYKVKEVYRNALVDVLRRSDAYITDTVNKATDSNKSSIIEQIDVLTNELDQKKIAVDEQMPKQGYSQSRTNNTQSSGKTK